MGVLPVAVIVLLLLMICIHAHFMRRIESFGSNSAYYLAGDGSWAGQMAAASAAADGSTGLVPAPLVGQQNSYLRGDGKWIQANNAPTVASILYATCYADQAMYENRYTSRTGPFQTVYFDTPLLPVTSNITQNTIIQSNFSNVFGTTFTLAAGGSYKLTGSIGYTANENGAFQWFNVTTRTLIGAASNVINGVSGWNSNILAYVTPAVTPVTVALVGTQLSAGTLYGAGWVNNINPLGWGPYVNIEQVSNNNTITPFAGATATKDGAIGYIPAPLAGQQNYVLTGGGGWSPYRSTLGPFTVSGSSLLISGIPPSKKITITYDLLGITDTNNMPIIQLGTSGGIVNSNYNSNQNYIGPTTGYNNQTNGFWIGPISSATEARTGQMILTLVNNNIWVSTGQCTGPNLYTHFNNGRVNLSGVLDRLQITSNGGTFNTANSITVLCEM